MAGRKMIEIIATWSAVLFAVAAEGAIAAASDGRAGVPFSDLRLCAHGEAD